MGERLRWKFERDLLLREYFVPPGYEGFTPSVSVVGRASVERERGFEESKKRTCLKNKVFRRKMEMIMGIIRWTGIEQEAG